MADPIEPRTLVQVRGKSGMMLTAKPANEDENALEWLLRMADEIVSDETHEVLAKLPADYFERFRYYAYAPPWERESDTE